MPEVPRNPYEILFLEAAELPERLGIFEEWMLKQEFVVPCELALGELASPERELSLRPDLGIRLKAFQQEGVISIPFFSDLKRFEVWSAPDPQGKFARLSGRTFLRIIPSGAAALLNPGSARFSKWFTSEEIADLLMKVEP